MEQGPRDRPRIALAALAAALMAGSAAPARAGDVVPMFCALRAMGDNPRVIYFTGVFEGDYTGNMLGYENRFASFVNGRYRSLGGQYATYCFSAADRGEARAKLYAMAASSRSSGEDVVFTSWG